MKNFKLVDNAWIEIVDPEITPEERAILQDGSYPPSEQKLALVESIKNRMHMPASEADATAAQAVYDQHKIAEAVLIEANITLPAGIGIINCRVNGEHKQIRF